MWLRGLIKFGWCVGLGMACQAEQPLEVMEPKVILKVGLAEDLKGSSKGSEPSGVFVDTLEAIAANLNLHLEWVEVKEGSADDGLRAGDLDLLLGVPRQHFSGEDILLSNESLLKDWGQIYVDEGTMAKRIRRLPDVGGLRIGYIEGDVHWPVLKELISLYQIRVEEVSFSERVALVKAMEEGVIDLIATGRFDARIVKNSLQKLKATSIHYNERSLHLAYGAALNPALRELIEQELFIQLHTPESAYFRAIDDWWGVDGSDTPYGQNDQGAGIWQWLGVSKTELILVFALLLALLRLRESQLQLKHLKRDHEKRLELEQKLRSELKKIRQKGREASADSASL